jgi:hypothetical protein
VDFRDDVKAMILGTADSLKSPNFVPGVGMGVPKNPGNENRPGDRPAQFW